MANELARNPLAMVWLVSVHAPFTGVLLLALAFRARKWTRTGGLHGEAVHGPRPPL